MSSIAQVKNQIEAIATQIGSQGSQLSSLSLELRRPAQEVESTMGGSAQGHERGVVEAINNAAEAVRNAAEALDGAAKAVSTYGQSL